MKKVLLLLLIASTILNTLIGCSGPKTDPPTSSINTSTINIQEQSIDWEIAYFVDEFGDSTSDAYIRGTFAGTFSNSATSRSSLLAVLNISKNLVWFKMFEYRNHIASFSLSDEIILKTKSKSGQVNTYSLMCSEGMLCCSSSIDEEQLKDAIFSNEELNCVITATSKYHSMPDEYRFKINNKGLSDLYNQIKK